MKRKNNSQKGQGYESPKVEILEVEFQDVLCMSEGASYPSSLGGVHFQTDGGSWGD